MSLNFCPSCGNKVNSEANFCVNCGFELKVLRSKREKILNERKNRGANKIYSIIILASIAIFTIVMLAKSIPSYKNPIIEAQPKVISRVDYRGKNLEMSYVEAKVRDGKIILPLDIVIDKKVAKFALAFSSGMAAETTLILTILNSGDHVVAFDDLYAETGASY